MRADLASMWSTTNRTGSLRRLSAKFNSMRQHNGKDSVSEYEKSANIDEDDLNTKANICSDLCIQSH